MGSHVSLMSTNTWTRIQRTKDIHGNTIILPRHTLLTRNVSDFECSCTSMSRWKYSTFKSGKNHYAQGVVIILGSSEGGIRIFEAVDDDLSEEEARTGSCTWKSTEGIPHLRLRVSLQGHAGKINAASTGVEGNIGATCGDDKKVLIWDLKHDKILHTMKGHSAKVKCCKLSNDGKVLVSGDMSGKMMIWDVQKGSRMGIFGEFKTITEEEVKSLSIAELRALEHERSLVVNHTDAISCCALSQMEPYHHALSGSWDTTLMLWDLSTLQCVQQLRGHSGRVTACTVTPHPHVVASASLDATVRIWDLRAAGEGSVLRGHAAGVTSCAASSSTYLAPLLLSGSADGRLKTWDLRRMEERDALPGHADAVVACAMPEGGELACSAGRDGLVRVWATRHMHHVPLSIFVGARGEEVEQVEHLWVDERDEIYCAKEQYRVRSLRRTAGGAHAVPDPAYRDVEPGRQKWTCQVDGRKRVLDAYCDRSTLLDMRVPSGTPVRLHPPPDAAEYRAALAAAGGGEGTPASVGGPPPPGESGSERDSDYE